jgi:hypothetical protein
VPLCQKHVEKKKIKEKLLLFLEKKNCGLESQSASNLLAYSILLWNSLCSSFEYASSLTRDNQVQKISFPDIANQ